MPLNSRNKGASGERELCDVLTSAGLMARRTVQYCGKSGDAADVRIDGCALHVEVKRTEKVKLHQWAEQAVRDAHGRPWAIFTRRNHGEWFVVVPLAQWLEESRHAQDARTHTERVRDEAISPRSPV